MWQEEEIDQQTQSMLKEAKKLLNQLHDILRKPETLKTLNDLILQIQQADTVSDITDMVSSVSGELFQSLHNSLTILLDANQSCSDSEKKRLAIKFISYFHWKSNQYINRPKALI